MNSLIPFPPGRDANLPPARRALSRLFGELAGLAVEDERQAGFETHLQSDVAKATAVEEGYNEAIDADANLLLQRLRDGLLGALGSIGGRARRAGAEMLGAHSDRLIAERALAAVIAEREKIQRRVEELNQEKQVAIDSVTIEAIGAGLKAELAEALETARIALTRIEAMHRAVDPAPIDYIGSKRAAIVVDRSLADDVELVVEGREVEKAHALIQKFKAALESDPLASAPVFEALDHSIDEGVVFHDLKLSEQRERVFDPRFQPKITQKSGAV